MLIANINQRKAAAQARANFAIRAALLTLLGGATALGYVWEKHKIYQLGNEIRLREQELETLRKRQAVLQVQLAQLKAPRAIWEKAQRWDLGLVVPREAQIVRLPKPIGYPPTPSAIYFAEPSVSRPATSEYVAHESPSPVRRRGG